MKHRIKNIVLFMVFSCTSLCFYGQYSQHPPAPRMSAQSDDGPQPCPGYDPDPDDDPITPPPPVGLCVPIDEYILVLVLGGLFYGIYKTQKMQEKA